MTIGFILNGEDVVINTNAENRLVDILRNTFGLLRVKAGCRIGNCGSCLVIHNGEVIKSCLIPAFQVRGSEIITIEGFSQTNEYQDIILGFREEGVDNCSSCNTGKILATEALLSKNPKPSPEEILAAFNGIKCRCTEPETLVRGINCVAEHRRKRIYGRSI